MEPTGNEVKDPDIIIASCSAFNEKGYRVGYGGGFFDRTLSQLKQKKKIISILAAFENQKLPINFKIVLMKKLIISVQRIILIKYEFFNYWRCRWTSWQKCSSK